MTNLAMITADSIGEISGGGGVTLNEYRAMESLDTKTPPLKIDRTKLVDYEMWKKTISKEPWKFDKVAASLLSDLSTTFDLVHFYGGTFSETINLLQDSYTKVTYTAAAHDLAESIKEHEEELGAYPYTHMSDQKLFAQYCEGYQSADVLIVPSPYYKKDC